MGPPRERATAAEEVLEASSWAEASEASPVSGAELLKTTWALAWPVIFSFSIESITGLCDMLMVGRLGSTAVAAVGVGVQILGAVNTALFAVGTGTLAVVARQIGAGEGRDAAETLRQSVFAALALSVLAVVPVFVWAPAIIGAFHVGPDVVVLAVPFVRVVMCAVPAEAVVFVVMSSLRGAGDMRTPLAVGAGTAVLNIVAAYVLIFGKLGLPALGVVGGATATSLAFTTGALVGAALVGTGKVALHVRWRPLRLRMDVIRRVLRIGAPAAAEHLLMQVGFFLYIVFATPYGTAAVAAYFIGVRILALSFLPGFGFAAAAATMVGQSLGARRPDAAERSGWASTRLGTTLMSVAGAGIFFAARPIARLFVADEVVIADTVAFIRVLAAAQPLMAIDFTLGGALRGAGDTRYPLLAVIVGFYGCRLGFAALVTWWFHATVFWLWFALVGDYFARSILKATRFHSGHWKRVRV
jgi:putative MATE family efflux protein